MDNRKKTHIHYLTYFNSFVSAVLLATLLVVVFSDIAPVEFVTNEICDQNGENCESNIDAINIAVQLGRLDFVSICLAILGAAIAMAALFSFLSIRDTAELVAGRSVREKWEYWENEVLPKLTFKAISKLMPIVTDQISDESADDIAASAGGERENEH